MPRDHGIVGNGWYFRDVAQVMFWKQANQLVAGEKVWETARRRDPSCTTAKMFWWYNMYSSAEWSVTPRPIYRADGLKVVDVYSQPSEIRDRLVAEHGAFPFFNFWGPTADLRSSAWIADTSMSVDTWYSPTLLLIYLPHLDYNLQRLGPDDPKIREDVRAIDAICGELIAHCRERGRRILVVSEYGLVPVSGPVHINRVLREQGLLAIRDELGTDTLDAGASEAFAVADHQVAHVYVRNPARINEVASLIKSIPGVDAVLDRKEQRAIGLDHERSGELVAISGRDKWFTYYFWLDDSRAPDFARTVEIHRKPGYDPVELFLDPAIRIPPLTVGWKLMKRRAGFRSLLDVIPLDATLVKGSHGRQTGWDDDGPVFISRAKDLVPSTQITSIDVHALMLAHLRAD